MRSLSRAGGGSSTSFARAHLLPRDVEELIGNVERFRVVENFFCDPLPDLSRSTRCRVIFPRTLNLHTEDFPLRRPLHFPREFRSPPKRTDRPLMPAPLCPCHEVFLAGVGHFP